MSAGDGFRGRAAALVIVGDYPDGAYVRIDDNGIVIVNVVEGEEINPRVVISPDTGPNEIRFYKAGQDPDTTPLDQVAKIVAGSASDLVPTLLMSGGATGSGTPFGPYNADVIVFGQPDAGRVEIHAEHRVDIFTRYEGLTLNGYPVPLGVLVCAKSNAAATAVTTTETKDGGTGDVVFEALPDHSYLIKYSALAQTSVASTTMDLRIRDGGASSPTAASTLRTVGRKPLPIAAGPGSDQLVVEQTLSCPLDIDAGTHTLAAFYVRNAGAGTVVPTQTGGQLRELTVTDTGRAV